MDTSPSSIVVFKTATAVPLQYLSTTTSGSTTMTVTMTSTSTSTRVISVMMNTGYLSAVPFAIAAASRTEACTPSTVYITVTGTETSTVLGISVSTDHSGTAIGGVAGTSAQSNYTPAVSYTETSSAVYGAVSGAGGSTGMSSATKPYTITPSSGVSGISSVTGNFTAPAMPPFLTPNNGNNNDTLTNNAGGTITGVPCSVVLAALLMVGTAFAFAL